MHWQVTPYVVGLSFTVLLSLTVAAVGLRHSTRPGGAALVLMMLAVAEWAAAILIEANAVTLPLKVFWSQIAYLGTVSVAPFLLHFAVSLTHRQHRYTRPARWLVWSVPVVTLVMALTNERHNLLWSGFTFLDAEHHILIYERGPFWWVAVSHIYIVLLVSTGLLWRAFRRYRDLYRRQAFLLLASTLPPWGVNAVYLFAPALVQFRDWTPAAMAVSGAMLMWSLNELHLLDLVPVARDHVVESMEDALLVIDAQGRIADANAAARTLIGRRDLVGREAASVFTTWAGTPIFPARSADGGAALSATAAAEGEITLATGRFIAWHLTPLREQSRNLPGSLLLLRDVTHHRQTEAALRTLNATLELRVAERTADFRAEKERNDAILRSVSDGILMADRDLYVLYINPAFTALSGYSAEEALGCSVGEILGPEAEAWIAQVGAYDVVRQGELRLMRRDGRRVDIALTISPMKGHSGDVVGYACTQRDIGHIKRLDRARKSFLDNISHQLRTPVTTMRLYTHLMARTELSEQNRSNLKILDDQITWLNSLIEDILEMTTLDSGDSTLIWQPVALTTVVDHLLARYGMQAERAGLRLTAVPLPADLPAVMGDQNRLTQAASEITDNAIRFTGEGSVTLSARRAEKDGRTWVTLAVTDTGPGIPPAEQARVFDRFFRGSNTESGHIPGTGLGLSIAETIIQAHGGHLTLESDDSGTTFTVWLPALA